MVRNQFGCMYDFILQEAIQYLLPSGLFARSARPMMKHPHDVFLNLKPALFDNTGRPFHFLFYTARPHFNQVLHVGITCVFQNC